MSDAIPGELDHLVVATGAGGVAGQVGDVGAVGLAQRVEGLLVEPAAFAAEQLALHGVAHELVAEAEAVVLLLDQEAAVDQRPQVGDQLVLGAPVTERREHVEAGPGAEDRGGLDDAALVGRQPVELAADELG